MSDVKAFCSWCFKKTKHELIGKKILIRNAYKCTSCQNQTLICRYCSEMAKGKPSDQTLATMKLNGLRKFTQSWDNELCAEHDGSIASFSKLDMKISDITEYKNIFKREKRDIAKAAKITGLGVAGIVSVAGITASGGAGAAPVAAALGNMGLLGTAATGTAISTLSGAALTSASLAAVGGSVAAGTAIISATGLALGGVMGGVVANSYYGDDKSFAISKLRDRDPEIKTIFINGFTQENEIDFYDWQCAQLAFDPSHTMYSVNWASKTNAKLGMAFGKGVGTQVAKKMLIGIAKAGGKKAAIKLSPIGLLALVGDLVKNPWHNSMFRAAQTGIQVAEAISRTEGQKFNLVGHSLGCRVIYYALEALSTKNEKYINDVILLGGAVGRKDKRGWEQALSSVDGCLHNCHSKQDKVLSVIYKTANAGLSSPIGISPIELESPQLKNHNFDNLVESHMTWKKHYEDVLKRIYT